ncbi:MAG: PQQ-binding-like beta-propeller repeat protein, partial [Myxococcota bacterium]|nr:PQQ-binding-like beta-propeller repeat protein [Myxococcota bacterium]
MSIREDGVETVWTAAVASSNRVPIALSGGRVLVGSDNALHAFDLVTGAALWPENLGSSDVVEVVPSDLGLVFVLTFDELRAVDEDSGETLWVRDLLLDLDGVADEAMDYGAGALFLGGDPLRKMDPSTGLVLAERQLGSSNLSALDERDGSIYVAGDEGVQALSSFDLELVWTSPTTAYADNVVVNSNTVFHSVLGEELVLLDRWSGGWLASTAEGQVFERLGAVGSRLLAGRSDGTLVALTDGELDLLWEQPGDTPVRAIGGLAQSVFYAHGNNIDGL